MPILFPLFSFLVTILVICASSIGFHIPAYPTTSSSTIATIYSDKEAQDYAEYILKQSCLLGNTISFQCTLVPHLDLDNTFTLTDNYYGYNREEPSHSKRMLPC